MRILDIIASVDPRFGGPSEGIRQFSSVFTGLGHHHEILTLDLPGASFLQSYQVPVHAVGGDPRVPGFLRDRFPWGRYAYSPAFVPWIRDNAHRFDIAIVNSLWNYGSFGAAQILPKTDLPYVVFTHGMMDSWFRDKKPVKHLVKQLFWLLGEGRLAHHAASLCFTTEQEKLHSRNQFWGYPYQETTIGYGTAAPPGDAASQRAAWQNHQPALKNRRYLLHLSRLHPIKGIDLLITAFAKIAQQQPDLDLVIAGPDHEDWAATVLHPLAASLGVEKRIHWPGMLSSDLKWGAFRCAEAMTLASHHENFGVVVAEALACGIPVLVSDKVNIWHEIIQENAGLVEADTQDGINALLQRWCHLSPAEKSAMAGRAEPCFRKHFSIEHAGNRLLDLLRRHARQVPDQTRPHR